MLFNGNERALTPIEWALYAIGLIATVLVSIYCILSKKSFSKQNYILGEISDERKTSSRQMKPILKLIFWIILLLL